MHDYYVCRVAETTLPNKNNLKTQNRSADRILCSSAKLIPSSVIVLSVGILPLALSLHRQPRRRKR